MSQTTREILAAVVLVVCLAGAVYFGRFLR